VRAVDGVPTSSGAVVTFGLTGLYLGFMLIVARPIMGRAVRAQELREPASQTAIAVAVIGLLLSTIATEGSVFTRSSVRLCSAP
jgi:hypothetical protein